MPTTPPPSGFLQQISTYLDARSRNPIIAAPTNTGAALPIP
jgi:hypothetical protein